MQAPNRSGLPSPLFACPATQPAVAADFCRRVEVDAFSSASSGDSVSSDSSNVGAAPALSIGVQARVLFDFAASGPGELSVASGQRVRALYHVDRRWLFVLTQAGQVGYIPFLYAAKEDWTRWRSVPSLRRYCLGLQPAVLDTGCGSVGVGGGEGGILDSGNCDAGSSSNLSGGGDSADGGGGRICQLADTTKPPLIADGDEKTQLQGQGAALAAATTSAYRGLKQADQARDTLRASKNRTQIFPLMDGLSESPPVPIIRLASSLSRSVGLASRTANIPADRVGSLRNETAANSSMKLVQQSEIYPAVFAAPSYATPSRLARPRSLGLDRSVDFSNPQNPSFAAVLPPSLQFKTACPQPLWSQPQCSPPAPRRQRRPSFDSAVTSAVSLATEAVINSLASRGSHGVKRVTFRAQEDIIGFADNIDRQPYCPMGLSNQGLIASRVEAVTYFGFSAHDTDSTLQTLV